MRWRIREIQAEDAAALSLLIGALNRELDEPTHRMTPRAITADLLGEDAWLDGLIATAAGEPGEPVGYALFHPGYETAHAARGFYLLDLYVVPQARRHGIAGALVAAVAHRAQERGAGFLWWVSKPWNEPAQRLYARWGASHEPVVAHALTGAAFARMAAAGAPRGPGAPAQSP